MQKSDFHFHLPDELIAQYPTANRSGSRLMVMETGSGHLEDQQFRDLPGFLQPGDLLVFNDTRVIPARIFGKKSTGGKIEMLLERIVDEHKLLVMMKANRKPAIGDDIFFDNGVAWRLTGRQGQFFELTADNGGIIDQFQEFGEIPLPPYIERQCDDEDRDRYQTVYANKPGAVAAPTAGLHFEKAMITALGKVGVDHCYVTLHVGSGTFQPVKEENLEKHKMHSEYYEITESTAGKINRTKAAGGRVVAVGTTVVRTLESVVIDGLIPHGTGETDIFIKPGFNFRVVDALLTNFHLPGSTLIMLVSAFAGFENTMKAYQHAVEKAYRFFSYGDAMFLHRG